MNEECLAFRERAYELGFIIDAQDEVEFQTAGLLLRSGAFRTINNPDVFRSLIQLAERHSPREAQEIRDLATPVDELMGEEMVIWREKPWRVVGNQVWVSLS